MKENIQQIVKDISFKPLEEIKNYLTNEINKYDVNTFKDFDLEMKYYIHKLYSFLYFCNECDNINHTMKCINHFATTNKFKDRNIVINLMR